MNEEYTPAAITCAECEAMLSDYREGTLEAKAAAMVRQHFGGCAACSALLASVAALGDAMGSMPRYAPPERVVRAILAQTLSPRIRRQPFRPSAWQPRRWWRAVSAPRFSLGLAMSFFAVALALSAAQVNLRVALENWSPGQLAPAQLAATAKRQWSRGWARGVRYYHDLRVVYEIEAATHALQQPAPPARGPDRTERREPGASRSWGSIGIVASAFAPPLRAGQHAPRTGDQL